MNLDHRKHGTRGEEKRKGNIMRIIAIIFLLSCCLALLGCVQPANTNQTANTNVNTGISNPKWDAYVDQFLTDYFTANPTFAIVQGRHEFDGKLPDWSAEGLNKEISRLKAEREKAAAFKDDQLDERQRF